ncbi:glutamate--cysteine ligase [Streptacidiphilus sp. N1-3]|uniref:Putative glutamate--cysteine ligase 2 n=1 Tax=Streptacidiphilus alkalitolerans TaxID=3342712 RepID=A0ABV6XDW3_9ACTN
MTTLGVEEEYLLLDPGSGLPAPESRRVREAADLMPALGPDEVEPELLQAQVEIATPVCETLDEVAEHLLRLRGSVARAAAATGCRLAATGAAPLRGPEPVPVTSKARYRAMAGDAPQVVDEMLINGMHVHVAVADREDGVVVLNRIRPWLPVLVAMGANSPLWDGGDTGFASWRTLVFDRWPVSGPPPVFADDLDYTARTQALLDAGAMRDLGQIYWQARLSERYPTVEVRTLDVQLRVEDAVTLAGVVRALVLDALAGGPATAQGAVPPELVAAGNWQAARYGLGDRLIDPRDGRPRRAGDVVAGLVDRLGPALKESGDLDRVGAGVEVLLREGSPAERQRRAFHEGGVEAVLELIAAA